MRRARKLFGKTYSMRSGRFLKAAAPSGRSPANSALVVSASSVGFVTGEYNWGVQPGQKNLTDHFPEEWFWRPALGMRGLSHRF